MDLYNTAPPWPSHASDALLCATSTGAIPAKLLLAARAACPAPLPPASIVHPIYSRASHNAFVPANNTCRCLSLTLAYKQIPEQGSKVRVGTAYTVSTASDSTGCLSQTRSGSPCTGPQSALTIFFLLIFSYFCFLVAAFRPCHSRLPRRKYFST